ncbi:MAG TPA: L-threonylcarbamoyladenylate synthase [Flavilitoribacter sp.]|nr:L-threonylcarbamoyladenylate synthase [Flavilitoribacter sp.]HMQ87594.1 L-threonylcarbamoyladenylate synthase [Flavilitoribacter sp.]
MLLRIHPDNPEQRKINQVIETMQAGGVIIYPTDTVYGLGCDILQPRAVDKICAIRGLDPNKAMLTMICKDISQVAAYAQQIDNQVYRILRKHLPGPFTFVLKAGRLAPKVFHNRKNTIGFRIPDNPIAQAIVDTLGRPILSASLKSDDEILEYFTDPEDIFRDFQKIVDIVIDGGIGNNVPSTIVDCTGDEPEIIREGAGTLEI